MVRLWIMESQSANWKELTVGLSEKNSYSWYFAPYQQVQPHVSLLYCPLLSNRHWNKHFQSWHSSSHCFLVEIVYLWNDLSKIFFWKELVFKWGCRLCCCILLSINLQNNVCGYNLLLIGNFNITMLIFNN